MAFDRKFAYPTVATTWLRTMRHRLIVVLAMDKIYSEELKSKILIEI